MQTVVLCEWERTITRIAARSNGRYNDSRKRVGCVAIWCRESEKTLNADSFDRPCSVVLRDVMYHTLQYSESESRQNGVQ